MTLTPESQAHFTAPAAVFTVPPGPCEAQRQELADANAAVIVARAVLTRMAIADYAANRREKPEGLADTLVSLAARDYIAAAARRRSAQIALDDAQATRPDHPFQSSGCILPNAPPPASVSSSPRLRPDFLAPAFGGALPPVPGIPKR